MLKANCLFIVLIIPAILFAQKKTTAEINVGIKKSIGKDVLQTFVSSSNNATIEYYSKKKFNNPHLEVSADVLYSLHTKLKIGLKSGVHILFSEVYTSAAKKTSLSVPLQVSCRYSLYQFKENSLGLNISGGAILFQINGNNIEKYKNGMLFNTSAFYSIKKNIIKFGIEKQIDNVTFYLNELNPYFTKEKFKYTINRLSLYLSYAFIIK